MKKFSVVGLILFLGAIIFLAMTGCKQKPNAILEGNGPSRLDMSLVKKTQDFTYRIEVKDVENQYYYTNVKPVKNVKYLLLREVYAELRYKNKVYDIKTKEYLGVYCDYYSRLAITTPDTTPWTIFRQK